jgi:hypothetical protein
MQKKDNIEIVELDLEQLNRDGEIVDIAIGKQRLGYERYIEHYNDIEFLDDHHCAWCGSDEIHLYREYECQEYSWNQYIWECKDCKKLTSIMYNRTAIEKYED